MAPGDLPAQQEQGTDLVLPQAVSLLPAPLSQAQPALSTLSFVPGLCCSLVPVPAPGLH